MNEEKFCRACDEPVEDRIPGCPLQCGTERCTSYKKQGRIDYSKTPIIWVIGGPGSGKSTQCMKIAAKYGYYHLSTGDMLRDEVARGTDLSKCLMSVLEHGGLAPADLVLSLLKESIEVRVHGAKGFVIEGYPRELRQGVAFEKAIAPANAIIYLEVSRETLISRLKGRAATATSAHLRDDENTINARLKAFYDNYKKVLAQFPNIVTKINAEQSVDEIFKQVEAAIDPVHKQIHG